MSTLSRLSMVAKAVSLAALLLNSPVRAQDNTWVTKAPMPTPRGDMAVGSLGGNLYLAGGGCPSADGVCTSSLAYNPKADAWVSRASLGFRIGSCAAVLDGKLYLAGGSSFSGPIADVVAYDPRTDTWVAKAPMPTARFHCAAGVVDGILYIAGGLSVERPGALAVVERGSAESRAPETLRLFPCGGAAAYDGVMPPVLIHGL